jgi:hypothetical protein
MDQIDSLLIAWGTASPTCPFVLTLCLASANLSHLSKQSWYEVLLQSNTHWVAACVLQLRTAVCSVLLCWVISIIIQPCTYREFCHSNNSINLDFLSISKSQNSHPQSNIISRRCLKFSRIESSAFDRFLQIPRSFPNKPWNFQEDSLIRSEGIGKLMPAQFYYW